MTLINIASLSKYFGEHLLIENASFSVNDNDHIGFVGANGSGKTTLFKIIVGSENYDAGSVAIGRNTVIGYMEQFVISGSDATVYDEVLKIFRPLEELDRQIEEIHEQIDKNGSDINGLIEKQHLLQEEFQSKGGLTYKSRTRSTLLGLGFTEEELYQKTPSLSGGQKSKLQLAKLLLSNANLLLLDEPTNHLDIQSVEWLEEYLKNFNGAYIIISHDRYFLDNVTNKTFELANRKITPYNGKYSDYLLMHEENEEILQRHYDNTIKEIHRIEGIVEQQRRWNREKNIKTAESKLKQIARLEKTLEKPEHESREINFKFSIKEAGGNDVLISDSLALSYGGKELFSNVDLNIKRCERVFLIGKNGCGKSSLFKILTARQAGTYGFFRLGTQISMGYYDQAQADLHSDNTVLNEIWDTYPKMTETSVRSALAAFLFKGDDVFKTISSLSGGEKARVAILKLMLSQANFLLLDEPTNHLDIFSREALENALLDYEGTLFIVSHDRYLINKLATKIYAMEDKKVNEYIGNYDYYLSRRSLSVEDEPKKVVKVEKPNEYKLKKERESAMRKRQTAIKRTEAEIEKTESEISYLEEQLNSEETAADYQLLMSLTNELNDKQTHLEELFEKWEELENME